MGSRFYVFYVCLIYFKLTISLRTVDKTQYVRSEVAKTSFVGIELNKNASINVNAVNLRDEEQN